MSSSSSSRLSKLNIPLAVLWVASVVVAVAGYFIMIVSNKNEAALYTAGTANYTKLFTAQSGSTVGGMLLVVGVLGVLLGLVALAITRRPKAAQEVAVLVPEFELEPQFDDASDDEIDAIIDGESTDVPAAKDETAPVR